MLRKLGDMLMYFYASVLFSDCSEKNKAGIAHRSYQRKLEQFPAVSVWERVHCWIFSESHEWKCGGFCLSVCQGDEKQEGNPRACFACVLVI